MAKKRYSKQKKRNTTSNKEKQLRNTVIFGSVIIFVVALGYLLYLGLQPAGVIAGLMNLGPQTRDHDDTINIEFDDLPPVGGAHSSVWQNCGIYTEPVAPEHAVHSMEHGAAWITYQPDLPADEVTELQNFVRGQTFLILSPYPGLRSPVVASAWSVQIELDSASDSRLTEFVDRYRLGSTTPERGAACTGGTGEPLS
jgi:hypothetical protein